MKLSVSIYRLWLVFYSLAAFYPASDAGAVPGGVDTGFNPNINNSVTTAMELPDGKILVGGNFTSSGGIPVTRMVRLSSDGVPDAAFTTSTDATIRGMSLQQDGRILLYGLFTSVNGMPRAHIARVNNDGSLDSSFLTEANEEVYSAAVAPNGRIFIGGDFTALNGLPRERLAVLDSHGVPEAGFDASVNGRIRNINLQPDGKILIAGAFTTVNGIARDRIARLNADGTLDSEFNLSANGEVYAIAPLSSGGMLIGGSFTSAGGTAINRIAKVNANGTLDTSYNPGANLTVRSISVQTDGKAIVAGEFTVLGGATHNRCGRLLPNGLADPSFAANVDNLIYSVSIQKNGRVLTGGDFWTIGGAGRNRIGRMENDTATQLLQVTSPSRIQWLRGGASPESHDVIFEHSPDGGTQWNLLGAGTRISNGWELQNAALPVSGRIRARARITAGVYNSSSSLTEAVADYGYSAQEIWRYTYFGITAGTGDAADSADADNDGLQNLVEFAFGLDPKKPDAAGLPEWERSDDDNVLSFTRPEGVSGITYVVESSESLAPDNWTPIPNSGEDPSYVYYAPAQSGRRLFLRVRVTSP